VWTLADPDSTEWTLEHEASFTEIWADQSYKATGLPNKVPRLALIHPKNPDVLYFFLQERLFGVDVPARKVVECEVYGLVAPPSCCIATRFVRSWELPRALSSGGYDTSISLSLVFYSFAFALVQVIKIVLINCYFLIRLIQHIYIHIC
jgi:hypothetical protein